MNSNRANRASLTGEIRQQAMELGFSRIGFARAEALPAAESRLREWLARGYHGEMKWMARDPRQRSDPRQIFPEAQSVVAVALNYYTPHAHRDSPESGKVSRYAWGDDYHEVVGDRLRELLSWIKERAPEAEGKVCVDIQPMMDKVWAERAGLGWIGKHSNLITPDFGSWVFLGELILNLELAYDDLAMADQCGSCTLCLDACPTGAIAEPYVVNSNLCISHATIESRVEAITAEVSGRLEGWVYGCDICQDVCPWNQLTPITVESRFEPRDGNVNAALPELLELTPETYAKRFRRSAMKRVKLAGLQRNARALLGQAEDSRVPKTV